MKILRLLNKKYFSITTIFLFMIVNSFSENQPVDIWNIEKNETQENLENKELKSDPEINLKKNSIDVFNMQNDTKDLLIKVIDKSEERFFHNSPEIYSLVNELKNGEVDNAWLFENSKKDVSRIQAYVESVGLSYKSEDDVIRILEFAFN